MEDFNNIHAFLLDYDGVIKFGNKEVNARALEIWGRVFEQWSNTVNGGSIVLNTLKGITYFKEPFHLNVTAMLRERRNVRYMLIGNNGSFVYDLTLGRPEGDVHNLALPSLEFIVSNDEIAELLKRSGQDDRQFIDLIHEYNELDPSHEEIMSMESRLFWDNGFPGNDQIVKCAADLPEGYAEVLTDEFFQQCEQQGILVSVTRKVMELTSNLSDKASRLEGLREQSVLSPTTIAIADTPYGSDKAMFDYIRNCGQGYLAMPNGDSRYDSEEQLLDQLLEIFENLGFSSES